MAVKTDKSNSHAPARPTIVDVAQYAGVAVSTASMALNNHSAIKPSTREKVRAAADMLHYVPNQAARTLHGHKSYSIGALHWPTLNPLHIENSLELMRLAAQHNYNFKILWNDIYRPETIKPLLQSIHGSVDGLILYTPSNPETQKLLIEQLQKYRIPFVFSAYINNPAVSFVAPDLQGGARMAMEYLLELGHRKIATFADGSSPVDRGITEALASYGLPFQPACRVTKNIASYADAYEISRQMLLHNSGATAVFARSDFISLALIKAAWDMGRVPGKDLDIVSMDNTEQSAYYVPALTTVDFDKQKKNQLILDILMQQINEESTDPQQVFIQPQLIRRESSGNQIK